eukprot:CAMPEP_0117582318 /NCGR_PEP_ID=MMETSP0784-20121206/66364_1 /TAXON_ID=39447 /ORGANISM="" /LENGTH=155 /DNA_ID=CAMNT_0005382823 /DNA_START=69 /DNA_END=532 /DNA_ORIENTATION=-
MLILAAFSFGVTRGGEMPESDQCAICQVELQAIMEVDGMPFKAICHHSKTHSETLSEQFRHALHSVHCGTLCCELVLETPPHFLQCGKHHEVVAPHAPRKDTQFEAIETPPRRLEDLPRRFTTRHLQPFRLTQLPPIHLPLPCIPEGGSGLKKSA